MLFSRAGGGIKQQQIISENFNSKTLLSGKSLLKKVLIFSVLIELNFGLFFYSQMQNLAIIKYLTHYSTLLVHLIMRDLLFQLL